MRATLLRASVLALALLAFAMPASADEPKADTFGASDATKAECAADDFKCMLGNCDSSLETCETDAVGVPFLAAAYMALWVILLGFLLVVRAGQRKLAGELDDLRDRLDRLGKTEA